MDDDTVTKLYNNRLSNILSSLFGEYQNPNPKDHLVDYELIDTLEPWVKIISRYFSITVHGIENVPKNGPAMMVGNHGLFGFDGILLGYEIYKQTGRLWRALGEHMLFLMPGIRDIVTKIGAIPGTRENARNFLQAGHLVNTYPGGARDALKDKNNLYRLHWDDSYGFVKAALQAKAPIILHAGIGVDESYKILGKIKAVGNLLNNNRYELPIVMGIGPLPLPVKFDYYILPAERFVADSNDSTAVYHIHSHLRSQLQDFLDSKISSRPSKWFN